MTIERFVPVHVTLVAEPVLVYPGLQVQTTALLVESCEQRALQSHSPLSTRQLSVMNIRQTESEIDGS